MKATDFAAATSRTETARFYPPQFYNSHSTGSSSSIELGFPPALDGSGIPRAFYAWSTAGLIPAKSENASVRTVADRCRVHFMAAFSALFGLHRDIAAALAAMPDSDPERPVALTYLRNIRRVLKRPNLAPW